MEAQLRPIVLVSLPEELQLARALQREGSGGGASAELRARLAAQLPLADKLARADYVIDNRGTPEQLRSGADRVLGDLCRALGVDPARYRLPP